MPGYVVLHQEWLEMGLKATELATLVGLLSFENGESKDCFPSHKAVSKRAGCSFGTVARALARLVEMGVVEAEARVRDDGSQASNIYRIHRPTVEIGVEQDPHHADGGTPHHSDVPSTYSIDEQRDVLSGWNSLAMSHGLQAIRGPLSPPRMAKIRARLKEHPDLWKRLGSELPLRGEFHIENRYPNFGQICRPEYLESLLNGEKRGPVKADPVDHLQVLPPAPRP